ncbi:MAG: ABC transporter substrate-binding protein [Pirellulaceae bacterium]
MDTRISFQLRISRRARVGLTVAAFIAVSLLSGCGSKDATLPATSDLTAENLESQSELITTSTELNPGTGSVKLHSSNQFRDPSRPPVGKPVTVRDKRRLGEDVQYRPYPSEPQLSDSLVVGLDADMTSASAESGEAIRRGLELALEEINRSGGLLGKPVELIVRDHRGNPDRGLGNLAAFAEVPNLLGVFGGIHTPVAIRELEFIHENNILYLVPWAAGTPIVDNGHSPNYVFRVSVRDQYAGGFLVGRAVKRGATKIGLLLERTSWGRSNEKAMKSALANEGLLPVGEEWFNWGERNLRPQVNRFAELGCDAVLLVCNPLEGVKAVEAVAALPKEIRPAIFSHWGISGGDFFQSIKPYSSEVDLSFLQTFSFVTPRYPGRVASLTQAYLQRYEDCQHPEDIFAPVGTIHAYELMQMVAQAVRATQSADSVRLVQGLEAIRNYSGIIRDYAEPFPVNHHDALDASDFILVRYNARGVVVPLQE